jgi:type II secretory pathway predicted ATPase ExeA
MESLRTMYENFYNLRTRPFLTVPDPDVIYWSEEHVLTFTMMRYGLMHRAPITVITGEIGAGKTTLLRQLLREIPAELVVGLVSNMQDGQGKLLHWIMMALDQEIRDESYVMTFRRFQDFVIARYAEGKRVLLIFDEAQNLGVSALEELRMLSNINSDGDELLQLVLVGQPQLRDLLARPELVQFSQRISADFHLTPMSREEVAAYIHHRLQAAGASWRIFTDSTCELIHFATRGVPRLVNILCDLCMVTGFAADAKVIEEPLLRETLSSVQRRGIYQQFAKLPDAPTLVQRVR